MNHQLADYSVLVGAEGWKHSHWQGTFYPEDLPEDWQLSFYNSQYRCVYLPKSAWAGCLITDAEMWLKDTQANFRFILEPPENMTRHTATILEAMTGRAFVDDQSTDSRELLWFPPAPDLRALGRRIEEAVGQGRTLYLLNREGHLPSLERVRSLVEVMGY
ncbi:MAG TPA: hypothetical protein VEP67_02545 [Thiobacillaceae bacterium]|nr:hypothetical protein [Thiobacillaceae bacterium]